MPYTVVYTRENWPADGQTRSDIERDVIGFIHDQHLGPVPERIQLIKAKRDRYARKWQAIGSFRWRAGHKWPLIAVYWKEWSD